MGGTGGCQHGWVTKALDALVDLLDPESLPTFEERLAPHRDRLGAWYDRPRPIDIRHVSDPMDRQPGEPGPTQGRVWLRADGTLPGDPLLHACVVAYASDLTLLDT